MRLYERFCGVRILTFCVMSNHFHLLVEVPPRAEEGLEEEEFFRRLAARYPERKMEEVRGLLAQRRAVGDEEGVEELRGRYERRMCDLGSFMQSLKQCFSTWFNRRHGRRGTLWEERYKGVLVEDGQAARVMTAYIDLNPIRAGMVKRPEDYRWCGYAEAVAGGRAACGGDRAGDGAVSKGRGQGAGGRVARRDDGREFMAEYRVILFFDGEQREREDAGTGRVEVARRGISPKEVARVLDYLSAPGEAARPKRPVCPRRSVWSPRRSGRPRRSGPRRSGPRRSACGLKIGATEST